MKISGYIALLEKFKAEYGDLPVAWEYDGAVNLNPKPTIDFIYDEEKRLGGTDEPWWQWGPNSVNKPVCRLHGERHDG